MEDLNNKFYLRDIIGSYMVELGKKSEKVLTINSDLSGTCRNKSFVEMYPNRSFNVGIAEQNMISFSAGLAKEGFVPYAFSMAPFITMRACEQCRTDVAYSNLNVRFIGIYAGVSGGISGATHWAIEDCGIMTSIPNIAVIELSDPVLTQRALDFSVEYNGPIYFRSTIEPVSKIYDDSFIFKLGGSNTIIDGNDGAILCSGVTVQFAIEASKKIKRVYNKNVRVVDMYSIKPIDVNAIISASKTGAIVAAQDHNIYGGLGSMIAKVIAENNCNTKYKILGIDDSFVPMAHAEYLYNYFKIDSNGIVSTLVSLLKK